MERRREADNGYITIKAVHVWGPFVFQLVMLMGGWFAMQQKVEDLIGRVDRLETTIQMLQQHLWKSP